MATFGENLEEIKILLIGDMNVGKTCMIHTVITEEFPDESVMDMPARSENITIPPDVTPELVATTIVDFSLQEQTFEDAQAEIESAHAICVVFAYDDIASVEDIETVWLPMIEKINENSVYKRPIILVGNKYDLVQSDQAEVYNEISTKSFNILNEYQNIVNIFNCSAKNLNDLFEIFFFAQKAVIHPEIPIFDSKNMKLTDKCELAMRRIFRVFDFDKNNLLNDNEMIELHRHCFDIPMLRQDLLKFKNAIKERLPGDEGVFNDEITLEGFLQLQILLAANLKTETIWGLLRKFGYNNNMDLKENYLYPSNVIFNDHFVELSQQAIYFLEEIFSEYDTDNDGYLSMDDLKKMFEFVPDYLKVSDLENGIAGFSITPDNISSLKLNKSNLLDIHAFTSHFAINTYNNPSWLLGQLALLGYGRGDASNQMSAIETFSFNSLKQMNAKRNTFIIKVFGVKNCGKSTFLKMLQLDMNPDDDLDENFFFEEETNQVILRVEKPKRYRQNNDDKYNFLIFQEVQEEDSVFVLQKDFYDLVIFLLTNNENLQVTFQTSLPYFRRVQEDTNRMVVLAPSLESIYERKSYDNAHIIRTIKNFLEENIRFDFLQFKVEKKAFLLNSVRESAMRSLLLNEVNGNEKDSEGAGNNLAKYLLFLGAVIAAVALIYKVKNRAPTFDY